MLARRHVDRRARHSNMLDTARALLRDLRDEGRQVGSSGLLDRAASSTPSCVERIGLESGDAARTRCDRSAVAGDEGSASRRSSRRRRATSGARSSRARTSCFAPVLSLAEAPHHPHNVARKHLRRDRRDPRQPAPAPRFSRTPGSDPVRSPRVPAERTDEALRDSGLRRRRDRTAAERAAPASLNRPEPRLGAGGNPVVERSLARAKRGVAVGEAGATMASRTGSPSGRNSIRAVLRGSSGASKRGTGWSGSFRMGRTWPPAWRPRRAAHRAGARRARSSRASAAVASFDEDSVSMAVEAARDALRAAPGAPASTRLFFATTTPPYARQAERRARRRRGALPLEMRAARSHRVGARRAHGAPPGAPTRRATARQRAGRDRPTARLARAGGEGRAARTATAPVAFVARIEARRRRGRRDGVADARVPRHLARRRASASRTPWEERFALTQAYAPLLGEAVQARAREGQASQPTDLADGRASTAPNARAPPTSRARAKLAARRSSPIRSRSRSGRPAPPRAPRARERARRREAGRPHPRRESPADGADAVVLPRDGRDAPHYASRARSRPPDRVEGRRRLRHATSSGARSCRPSRRAVLIPTVPAGPPMLRSRRWKFGFVGIDVHGVRHAAAPPQRVLRCSAEQ